MAAETEAAHLQARRDELAASVQSMSEAVARMQRRSAASRSALGREQQESLREATLRREDEEAALQLRSILR